VPLTQRLTRTGALPAGRLSQTQDGFHWLRYCGQRGNRRAENRG